MNIKAVVHGLIVAVICVLWTGAPHIHDTLVVTAQSQPMQTATPTPMPSPPDEYENDNQCEFARQIQTNGIAQTHTFHETGDTDWVYFQAPHDGEYQILVDIPFSSPANVGLVDYIGCDNASQDPWQEPFARGVRITVNATAGQTFYIELSNVDVSVAGADVTYTISVRSLVEEPATGAVIIVAGRLRHNDPVQDNINDVAEAMFHLFQGKGVDADDIYFLATNSSIVGYDDSATLTHLERAITQWAAERVSTTQALTIYMISHGMREAFYLDAVSNQLLTPRMLDEWLTTLEANVPDLKSNIIIDATHSGSFIDANNSISHTNRVIITSTDRDNDTYASRNGVHFTDTFIVKLSQNFSLAETFEAATNIIDALYPSQNPWLDADGDGIPNEDQDMAIADTRGFQYAGSLAGGGGQASNTSTPTSTATGVLISTSTPRPTSTPSSTPTDTLILTPTATSIPTNTPIKTPTPSSTSTLTNTPSSTPHPTATPTITFGGPIGGDAYEDNNQCANATPIEPDGIAQTHTFHTPNDRDWLTFTAPTDDFYLIDVSVPTGSLADVDLIYYSDCHSGSKEDVNQRNAPGIKFHVDAEANQQFFIKLKHVKINVFGPHVRYEISVRKLPSEPPTGAVIILAGRYRTIDTLQDNINHTAQKAYQLFQNKGVAAGDILFLATDSELIGYDKEATALNLRDGIREWAAERVSAEQALTLYLIDHGERNLLYLDEPNEEYLTPNELDDWLHDLEEDTPDLKVNVIVEACYSGSFISPDSSGGSISRPGRLIITSTSDDSDAYASDGGIQFSDTFITRLNMSDNLPIAFQRAKESAQSNFTYQDPWLDGDGDGIPNEDDDVFVAAARGFEYEGTFSTKWPPFIVHADPPTRIIDRRGTFHVEVRDDQGVEAVWAVVYPPDYTPPTSDGEINTDAALDRILLTPHAELGPDMYQGNYPGFSESGIYHVVIHATDEDELTAQPVVLAVDTNVKLFLPVVSR
ncbi:MAG: C13 family peptidase [Chloroflexota bacterium]